MRRFRTVGVAFFAVVLAIGAAGCGENAAATTESSAVPTTEPADDMTLDDYLKTHGVTGLNQTASDLKGIAISIQQPPRWFTDRNNQVPGTYAVVANSFAVDNGFVPNAVIMVSKLTGDFDPKEAIRRGPVDARRYPGFREQAVTVNERDGMPTSVIAGTFDSEGKRLATHNRYTVATNNDGQRYLVLLTVTTTAAQQQSLRSDIDELDEGIVIRSGV